MLKRLLSKKTKKKEKPEELTEAPPLDLAEKGDRLTSQQERDRSMKEEWDLIPELSSRKFLKDDGKLRPPTFIDLTPRMRSLHKLAPMIKSSFETKEEEKKEEEKKEEEKKEESDRSSLRSTSNSSNSSSGFGDDYEDAQSPLKNGGRKKRTRRRKSKRKRKTKKKKRKRRTKKRKKRTKKRKKRTRKRTY